MKILHSNQIKQLDAYTIENEPISSINLMERAATACTNWIIENFGVENKFKIFVGPGNNGGDGLAIARMLAEKKYSVQVFVIKITDKFSNDFSVNYKRLLKQDKVKIFTITENDELPVINADDIIIDGLFGSGLSRSLSGFPAKVVNYLNKCDAVIIAIDIPSGLFGEDNSKNNYDNIINAAYTLTFQFPNLSFFFPENEPCVGKWEVLPIGLHKDFIEKLVTDYFIATKDYVHSKLIKRKKFAHKGNFGHALLISGSYGKMGAAVLASKACLRTGVGLITAHIPKKGYQIIQTAVPEAMISIDKSEIVYSQVPEIENYNAIGIGPGIGLDNITQSALKSLIEKAEVPIVFDADAINILAENKDWLNKIPANSIFTPHPKEFERIAGKSPDNYSRNLMQIEFAKKYNVYVVLKGAYTAIACPDGKCYFNSTGNPGMATAGSGDVLTGIILSFLAQKYSSEDAAILGVYFHGLAGDIAAEKIGEQALIAGDIIQFMGAAFEDN